MNKTTYIAAAVGIIVVILGAVVFMNKKSSTASNSNTTSFKDGTYTAEGDYTVHIGQKHISVRLTLKNSVITDATVTNEADDPTSVNYQNMFISGFKTQVVGKKISDVHLGRVSGSSLTPDGFNDALTKIEAQAKM